MTLRFIIKLNTEDNNGSQGSGLLCIQVIQAGQALRRENTMQINWHLSGTVFKDFFVVNKVLTL
jgi:hypothetical protein